MIPSAATCGQEKYHVTVYMPAALRTEVDQTCRVWCTGSWFVHDGV